MSAQRQNRTADTGIFKPPHSAASAEQIATADGVGGRLKDQPKRARARRVERVEPESSVLRRVTEALWATGGVEVFRNNVGAIKKGSRFIRYGLGVGSADLICIVAPHGRLLAIETKRPKGYETTEAQEKWLRKIRLYGGIAGVCRSPEEALALVELARKASL